MPQLDLTVIELGVNSLAREAKTMQIQTDDQGPCLCGDSLVGGSCTLQSGLGGRRKKRLPLFLNMGQQAAQRAESLNEAERRRG